MEISTIELRHLNIDDYQELKSSMIEAYINWPGAYWKEEHIKKLLTLFVLLTALFFCACDQNENVDIAGTYSYAGISSWDNDAGAYSSFTMEISIMEFYLYHVYQAGIYQEYLKDIDTSTVYYCPANARQYSNTAHVITLSNGETNSEIDFNLFLLHVSK